MCYTLFHEYQWLLLYMIYLCVCSALQRCELFDIHCASCCSGMAEFVTTSARTGTRGHVEPAVHCARDVPQKRQQRCTPTGDYHR